MNSVLYEYSEFFIVYGRRCTCPVNIENVRYNNDGRVLRLVLILITHLSSMKIDLSQNRSRTYGISL